jgi:hypothetical protein
MDKDSMEGDTSSGVGPLPSIGLESFQFTTGLAPAPSCLDVAFSSSLGSDAIPSITSDSSILAAFTSIRIPVPVLCMFGFTGVHVNCEHDAFVLPLANMKGGIIKSSIIRYH